MTFPEKSRCTATAKHSGQRCRQPAIAGGTVCRVHGGSAPQVAAKAADRVREQQIRAAAARIAVLVETTPEQALLDEVARCSGMIAYYEARVHEIEHNSLIWGVTKEQADYDGSTVTREAAPSIWLKLLGEERDRIIRAASAALKAGIEERRVALAESQGILVAAVIRRVLDRLDLTEAQQTLVPSVVPEELRALHAA